MPSQHGDEVAEDQEKSFLHKFLWVISAVGIVVGAVGGTIAIVTFFFPELQPERDQPKLELSHVDVSREKDIAADWVAGNDPQPVMNDWTTSFLSIGLRNRSADEVLVTEARFDFSKITVLGCPYGGGGSVVKARYDIKVPTGLTAPSILARSMKFDVPPHGNERIGFTVGPETHPEGFLPVVYTFTVTLFADDKSRLTTAPVVFMNPEGTELMLRAAQEAMREGEGGYVSPACVKEQASKARELVTGAALVSPELVKYSEQLSRLVALPSSPEPSQ